MENKYIAVYDSGIGGLNVLYELNKTLKNENFIYFGDNKNAPYGNKSYNQLKCLAFDNISNLLNYNIKLLVIGCNTLSLTLLSDIKNI